MRTWGQITEGTSWNNLSEIQRMWIVADIISSTEWANITDKGSKGSKTYEINEDKVRGETFAKVYGHIESIPQIDAANSIRDKAEVKKDEAFNLLVDAINKEEDYRKNPTDPNKQREARLARENANKNMDAALKEIIRVSSLAQRLKFAWDICEYATPYRMRKLKAQEDMNKALEALQNGQPTAQADIDLAKVNMEKAEIDERIANESMDYAFKLIPDFPNKLILSQKLRDTAKAQKDIAKMINANILIQKTFDEKIAGSLSANDTRSKQFGISTTASWEGLYKNIFVQTYQEYLHSQKYKLSGQDFNTILEDFIIKTNLVVPKELYCFLQGLNPKDPDLKDKDVTLTNSTSTKEYTRIGLEKLFPGILALVGNDENRRWTGTHATEQDALDATALFWATRLSKNSGKRTIAYHDAMCAEDRSLTPDSKSNPNMQAIIDKIAEEDGLKDIYKPEVYQAIIETNKLKELGLDFSVADRIIHAQAYEAAMLTGRGIHRSKLRRTSDFLVKWATPLSPQKLKTLLAVGTLQYAGAALFAQISSSSTSLTEAISRVGLTWGDLANYIAGKQPFIGDNPYTTILTSPYFLVIAGIPVFNLIRSKVWGGSHAQKKSNAQFYTEVVPVQGGPAADPRLADLASSGEKIGTIINIAHKEVLSLEAAIRHQKLQSKGATIDTLTQSGGLFYAEYDALIKKVKRLSSDSRRSFLISNNTPAMTVLIDSYSNSEVRDKIIKDLGVGSRLTSGIQKIISSVGLDPLSLEKLKFNLSGLFSQINLSRK